MIRLKSKPPGRIDVWTWMMNKEKIHRVANFINIFCDDIMILLNKLPLCDEWRWF